MKRKTFLIQILVLLFTFQNIWSVAEAACLHEMPNIPNSILSNPIDLDEKSDSPSQALYSLENYKEIYDYWTAPSILDMRPPHFEAVSNASGLIPSRCE